MGGTDLTTDPLLEKAPFCEGYKVLGGVVLYQKLGQGGMGAVYRGKHLRLEVDVALKVMASPPGMSPDEAANHTRRFIREAKTSAAIKHQNLIRVYDINTEAGLYFLIMDFIDGESAGERLKRKGRLSEREAVEICLGAAMGLGEAHELGIVHRDVKPDNIMIDKKGRVVVADLGLAKAYGVTESDSALTMGLSLTQQAMGTPYYMSPEQTRSAKDVGPQADVWSLGVTLWKLLTDKVPWQDTDVADLIQKIRNDPAPDVRAHCTEISDGLCGIIDKALRKDPKERHADCRQMVEALADHLDAMGASRKSVLPDSEAGSTRIAMSAVTPPPSRTLTLIGKSMLGTATPGTLSIQAQGTEAARSPSGVLLGARPSLPVWLVPAAVGAVLVLVAVLWAVLGTGGADEAPSAERPAQLDPLEAEARQLLERVIAAADADRLEEGARLLEEAGTRYDATTTGAKIARLAGTISTKLAAKKAKAEAEERARRKEAERIVSLVARAERAEEACDFEEALRLLRPELGKLGDPTLRDRVARLEQAAAVMGLIEKGAALEKAGDLDGARGAYRQAIPGAPSDLKRQAQERLAKVERRVETEATIAAVVREVRAREWLSAWDRIEKAKEGVSDPRLADLARQVLKALAPPGKLTGPLGVELVLVRGATFEMGSDSGAEDERPAHEVSVSSFYMGRYEVTKAQFDAFRNERRSAPRSKNATDNEPAVGVSWGDAAAFCRYLCSIDSASSGRGRRPARLSSPKSDRAADVVYRLPTEAQWEFAARGPEGRTYPWGDAPPAPHHANLAGDADRFARLAPVGTFPDGATPKGVMDLVGNAAEWCADWYGPYSAGTQSDPRGPPGGEKFVLRGGAFAFSPEVWSRASVRASAAPERRMETVGFRVVRDLTAEERQFERIGQRE